MDIQKHSGAVAFSDKKAAAPSALVGFLFQCQPAVQQRTLLCTATCMAVRAPRNINSSTKNKKALSGKFLPKCERKSPGWTGLTFKTLLALFYHMYRPKKWVGLCQFLSRRESISLYLCPSRVNFSEMLDLKHQHKYKLTGEQTMVSKDINVSSATLSSF